MLNKTPTKNNLYISNPVIAKEWHPTKNGSLKPRDVTINSNRKVWWLCPNDHVWAATVNERIHGACCPHCSDKEVDNENIPRPLDPSPAKERHPAKNESLAQKDATAPSGKKVSSENCPQTVDPDLAKEWHPTKNANRKIWWLCSNGHEWLATVSERNMGNSCPYCSGKKEEAENIREALSPSPAKEEHPAKNESLTAGNATAHSNRKVSSENCLQTVNPDLAKEWHPSKNASLTPQDVTVSSHNQVWWMCPKGHEWKAAISSRNKGQGCFYCSYMQRGKHS